MKTTSHTRGRKHNVNINKLMRKFIHESVRFVINSEQDALRLAEGINAPGKGRKVGLTFHPMIDISLANKQSHHRVSCLIEALSE